MKQKRLSDQVLVMSAIRQVKRELEQHMVKDQSDWTVSYHTAEILVRLGTLYSLLDLDKLTYLVLQADTRQDKAA